MIRALVWLLESLDCASYWVRSLQKNLDSTNVLLFLLGQKKVSEPLLWPGRDVHKKNARREESGLVSVGRYHAA
jgi:hypothetical protein